ncbi:MAG: type III-A CRISPR-associated RAMP protein Csm5 [Desulfobacterales bacterium]|nr:type III-A CRISPR-associated RAMP protein Csm5 [Desulfobacterales bacterium]
MKETIKFCIQTISPIHIGCDDVYEPTGFAIDEEAQQMVVLDSLSFISQLEDSEKLEFSNICAKGTIASILEVYKFLRNRLVNGRAVDVCHGFLEHYKKTLDIPLNNEKTIRQELNRFEIPRTAFRSVDQRPYIPGSTIKGALRTAYLNLMEREKKLSELGKERDSRKLEQRLMEYDGIPTDPFRMVKVSDFKPVGEIRTRIIYAVNLKKIRSDRDARGVPLIFEVVPPGVLFEGTIAVYSPPQGSGIREHVTIEKLLKSATQFYTKEKQREDKELVNIGANVISVNNQRDSFLVRVGRHSGAESVTVEGHRNIYIMGKRGEKGRYRDHSTTLWLVSETRKPPSVNNLLPFGWVQLSCLTDELSKKLQAREEKWWKKRKKHREESKIDFERHAELKRQAEEEADRLALEEKEMLKEEEKRKAKLEAMTPGQRTLEELNDLSISENRVIEIYNEIDGFSGESKRAIAQALKKYWEVHEKWKKAKGKKTKGVLKQMDRVCKIKAILGEE